MMLSRDWANNAGVIKAAQLAEIESADIDAMWAVAFAVGLFVYLTLLDLKRSRGLRVDGR